MSGAGSTACEADYATVGKARIHRAEELALSFQMDALKVAGPRRRASAGYLRKSNGARRFDPLACRAAWREAAGHAGQG